MVDSQSNEGANKRFGKPRSGGRGFSHADSSGQQRRFGKPKSPFGSGSKDARRSDKPRSGEGAEGQGQGKPARFGGFRGARKPGSDAGRSDRSGRSGRSDRSDRSGRSDRSDRSGRSERFGRSERPGRFDRASRFSREDKKGPACDANSNDRRDEKANAPAGSRFSEHADEHASSRAGEASRFAHDQVSNPKKPASPASQDGAARKARDQLRLEKTKATPGRVAALRAVHAIRVRRAYAQDIITKEIDQAHLSVEDRAFATKLVLGVVSMLGTLDDVINRCLDDIRDVQDDLRDALRISTYEIIYLEKTPYAAVDQGVELARAIAPRAGGLANAVLRKVAQSKMAFPFGDPKTDFAAYARLHGFPLWLAQRLVDDLGAREAHAFMTASNEQAPVFVAVNAARARDEEVLAVLSDAHGEPQALDIANCNMAGCYRLDNGRALLDGRVRRIVNNGLLIVSDIASQAVASLVLPEDKPASLLEVGAGRATKTVLLQSNSLRRWKGQIEEYVTVDNRPFKTKVLVERAKRCGVRVHEALTADATNLGEVLGEKTFDVVFIDAPCTGLGTLRRHPEIRWRLKPEDIASCAEQGARLLASAAAHVAPGGTLAYATCTVTPEENGSVVAAFLKSEQGACFELVPVNGKSAFQTVLTSKGSDSHFLAKLRRKDT